MKTIFHLGRFTRFEMYMIDSNLVKSPVIFPYPFADEIYDAVFAIKLTLKKCFCSRSSPNTGSRSLRVKHICAYIYINELSALTKLFPYLIITIIMDGLQ